MCLFIFFQILWPRVTFGPSWKAKMKGVWAGDWWSLSQQLTDNIQITLPAPFIYSLHSSLLKSTMQIAPSPFARNSGLLRQHGLCCWVLFSRNSILILVRKSKTMKWNLSHFNGKSSRSLSFWGLYKGKNCLYIVAKTWVKKSIVCFVSFCALHILKTLVRRSCFKYSLLKLLALLFE